MRESSICARSVELDAANGQARYDLAIVLLQEGQLEAAIEHLRATLQLMPNLVGAHNNLGIALASQGKDGRSDPTVSDGARARSRVRRDAAQSVSGHARTTARAQPLRFVGAAIVGESFLLTDP